MTKLTYDNSQGIVAITRVSQVLTNAPKRAEISLGVLTMPLAVNMRGSEVTFASVDNDEPIRYQLTSFDPETAIFQAERIDD